MLIDISKLYLACLFFLMSGFSVFGQNTELRQQGSPTDTLPTPKKSDVLIRELPLSSDLKAALPGETRAIFPIDSSIRIGKLGNGLTYYLKNNPNSRQLAECRLVVKAGAAMEAEDQLGAAFAIKAMAMKETENLQDNASMFFSNSIGGLDEYNEVIKEFSGFEETVFQYTTHSFTSRQMDMALMLLKHWAAEAVLDSVDFEKEKLNIAKSYKPKDGIRNVLENRAVFAGTKYGERMQENLTANLKALKPKALKRFYKEWYRPDLMAVVIVGDIDVVQLEKQLISTFSDLKKPADRLKNTQAVFAPNKEMISDIKINQYASSAEIRLVYKNQKRPVRDLFGYRQQIIYELINYMLQDRFRNIEFTGNGRQLPGFIRPSGNTEFLYLNIWCHDGRILDHLKNGLVEIERLKKHGFTELELENSKKYLNGSILNEIKYPMEFESPVLAEKMLWHFLDGEPLLDTRQKQELLNNYLPHIKTGEINKMIRQLMKDENCMVLIEGPKEEKWSYPDHEKVKSLVNEVQNMEGLGVFLDVSSFETLISGNLKPGKIRTVSKIDKPGIEHVTLENGAQFYLRYQPDPMQFIHLNAFSASTDFFDDEDFWSLAFAGSLIPAMGVGPLDSRNLGKLFYESGSKNASLMLQVNEQQSSFYGNAKKQSAEILIQLLRLYMTEPQKNKSAFDQWVKSTKGHEMKNRDLPWVWFDDECNKVIYKDSFRYVSPSDEVFDKMDLDRLMLDYTSIFGSPQNFTFVLTGDFDPVDMKQFIQKYIGSLPVNNEMLINEVHRKEVRKGLFDVQLEKEGIQSAKVRLNWIGNYSRNNRNDLAFDIIRLMTERFLNRNLKASSFSNGSPRVMLQKGKSKVDQYTFSIEFECPPDKAAELIVLAGEVVKEMKEGRFFAEDLKSTKEELILTRKDNLKNNRFWADIIAEKVYNQEPFDDILAGNYAGSIEKLTKSDIQKIAGVILNAEHFSKISMLPEIKK